MEKFKILIILGYFVLVLAAILGGLAIIVYRPDSFPVASAFLGTMLTGATGAVVTFYMLGKQNEKIDAVHTQVNGNLSRAEAEREQFRTQLIEAGITPGKAGD